jgi:hypothetical protein
MVNILLLLFPISIVNHFIEDKSHEVWHLDVLQTSRAKKIPKAKLVNRIMKDHLEKDSGKEGETLLERDTEVGSNRNRIQEASPP